MQNWVFVNQQWSRSTRLKVLLEHNANIITTCKIHVNYADILRCTSICHILRKSMTNCDAKLNYCQQTILQEHKANGAPRAQGKPWSRSTRVKWSWITELTVPLDHEIQNTHKKDVIAQFLWRAKLNYHQHTVPSDHKATVLQKHKQDILSLNLTLFFFIITGPISNAKPIVDNMHISF